MASHLITNKTKVLTMAYNILHDLARFLCSISQYDHFICTIHGTHTDLPDISRTFQVHLGCYLCSSLNPAFSSPGHLQFFPPFCKSLLSFSVKISFTDLSVFSTFPAHILPCFIFLFCLHHHLMHYNFLF